MPKNIRTSGVLLVAIAALVMSLPAGTIAAQSENHPTLEAPPNIVIILSDDQTVADMQWMPKTRALIGDKGVTYSTSWTSLSWCCPSRATLQTGQHAHNHGVFSNSLPAGGFQRFDHVRALPVWLKNAGYRTVHIGKALNDTGMQIPRGWDDWRATVNGDHKMYNWQLNDNGVRRSYGRGVANYQGDVYAAMAADAILRTPADQPLFLYYSLSAPHSSTNGLATPPRRYLGTVKSPFPRPPSFKLPAGYTVQRLQLEYRRRAESLRGADDQVETIVTALQSKGILDNTVIIYTSDNGYLLGEHGFVGKATYYQEAMAVPLLIRGPGFARGVVEAAPVQNIDIAPTIAELAGATPLITMDGISLLQDLDPNRGLFFESKRDLPSVPLWEGIRTDRFVYTERVGGGGQTLWDMNIDPYQERDLSNRPEYAAVKQALQRLLRQKSGCIGGDCYFIVDNATLDRLVG